MCSLNFQPVFFKRKINIKFCLLLWKNVLIQQFFAESSIKFLLRLSFVLIDWLLQCTFTAGFNSEQFTGSYTQCTGGFPNNIDSHRWLSETWLSSLNRVIRSIFTICSWFHSSKQKLILDFLYKKNSQKLWKPSVPIKKLLCWFSGPKKYFSPDTIPLID